jgi:hypothetical protein
MVDIGKLKAATHTLNALSLKISSSKSIEAYRAIVFEASNVYHATKADIDKAGCPGQSGESLKKALTYFQKESDKAFDRLRA